MCAGTAAALINTLSYRLNNQLNSVVMLFSLYRVSAEGKFHLFTCVKNGNKEILN
jgi:hypothetical protein